MWIAVRCCFWKLNQKNWCQYLVIVHLLQNDLNPNPVKENLKNYRLMWVMFMTFSLYLFDIFWETINFLQSFQLWQWLFCHTQPNREIFLKEILIISQFVYLTALYYLDENILLYDLIAWTRRKTDELCMPLYIITVTIMPVKTLYLLLWH